MSAVTYQFPMAVRPYQAEKVPDPKQQQASIPAYLSKTTQLLERSIPLQAGLLEVPLTDVQTVTLPASANAQPVLPGTALYVEVSQDGTGGWVPSYTNAVSDGGVVPPPALGALDSTLYLAVWNGSVWIMMLIASAYSSGSSAALALAFSRAISALLPLERVEVLEDGFALVFD